ELIHYLTYVKNFWATLVNHDRTRMALIDLHSVDTLQLYAPRASKVDRKTVKGKILGGEVFSNFSRSERAGIWEKIRTHEMCDGIIPSLHTFFRDIFYLELFANAVKRLLSISSLQRILSNPDIGDFFPTTAWIYERISSGYRQIWMYAMRHYPDMAKDLQRGPKANPMRAKARATADESVIHGMATLAKQLGFRTPPIRAILRQSPDHQIARAALLKARKPDHYHYDHETFESLVEQIADYSALAIPNEAAPVARITGRAIQLKERCGVPHEQTQQLDRPHIFFDTLHSATVSQRNLSSLERQGDRWHRHQERQQAVEHGPPLPQEPSIPSSIRATSTISEVMDMDCERSAAGDQVRRQIVEQQLAGSRGMDSGSEEPDDTEIDEYDLRNRSEGGSPGVEGTGTVASLTSGAPRDTDMSSVPDEGADAVHGAMDMGSSALTPSESVEDRARIPTTLSRQSTVQSPTIPTARKDTTWKPYDATQKGNRNVTKGSLAARGQSVAQGAMTNSEPSAEQRPEFGPLQHIAEHTELEVTLSVDEPDGPEHISGGPLPAEAPQGTVGEQIPPGTELITGAGGESQDDLNSDDGDENLAGTTEAGPSLPDTGRYPANTPDLEQAQREAIDRHEEEDSLFDSPHPLKETDSQEMEETQRRVTITFQVYERSQWSTTDVVSVSPDHLAEAQILADGYARDPNLNARFYDGQLRKVAVDECIRAAIDDGSFTVRMSFGRDLVVTRQLVSSIAPLRAVGSDEPARGQDQPGKRVKANAGTALAGPVQTPEDPAPTATSAPTSSVSERRNRKTLTPRIVARRVQDVRPRQQRQLLSP
ncbi:hypothetical protein AARAC_007638, partial [Aspergillus arachidicola]